MEFDFKSTITKFALTVGAIGLVSYMGNEILSGDIEVYKPKSRDFTPKQTNIKRIYQDNLKTPRSSEISINQPSDNEIVIVEKDAEEDIQERLKKTRKRTTNFNRRSATINSNPIFNSNSRVQTPRGSSPNSM